MSGRVILVSLNDVAARWAAVKVISPMRGGVDKIIRIILSREGLQVPYIHEVLS